MSLLLVHRDAANGAISVFADSRVTSPALPDPWDRASKIFPLQPTPHFAAYCGSSVAALSAFAQSSIAVRYSTNLGNALLETTGEVLKRSIEAAGCPWSMPFEFVVVGPARAPAQGFVADFRAFRVSEAGVVAGFAPREVAQSVFALGAGADAAEVILRGNANPSDLDVFNALKSVLADVDQPTVGGLPQMVTLSAQYSGPVGFVWPDGRAEENSLLGVPILHQQPPPLGPGEGVVQFRDVHFNAARFVGRGLPVREAGGFSVAVIERLRQSAVAGDSTEVLCAALRSALRPSDTSPQAFLYLQVDHEAEVPRKIWHVNAPKLYFQCLALLGASGGVVAAVAGAFPALGILAAAGLIAVIFNATGSVSVPTAAQSTLVFILCCSIGHEMLRGDAELQFGRACQTRRDVTPEDFAPALQQLVAERVVEVDGDGVIRLIQNFTTELR